MTDHQELPPLPSPTYFIGDESLRKGMHPCYTNEQTLRQHAKGGVYRNGYSADQMRAYALQAFEAGKRSAPAVSGEAVEMPQYWSVEVCVDGESLVSIGHDWLSGSRALDEFDERTIQGAAQHLLSFIGYGLPPCNFDPDAHPTGEVEKDAARLDWLQATGNSPWRMCHEEMRPSTSGLNHYERVTVFDGWSADGTEASIKPTIREAIDQAMNTEAASAVSYRGQDGKVWHAPFDQVLAAAMSERAWHRRTYGHHYYVDGAGLILGEVRQSLLGGYTFLALLQGQKVGEYITEESAKAAIERAAQGEQQ